MRQVLLSHGPTQMTNVSIEKNRVDPDQTALFVREASKIFQQV